MTRASWGKAKLVVQALSSDIHSLRQEGCNLEEMFHRLSKDGKLSIGKRTFKRHASEIIKEHTRNPHSSLSSKTEAPTLPGGHRFQANVGQSVINDSSNTIPPKPETPASSTPATPSRPGQTIIPGSSLKRGGFNDPEDPSVATEDLLDQYYGTATKSSDEKEPNE